MGNSLSNLSAIFLVDHNFPFIIPSEAPKGRVKNLSAPVWFASYDPSIAAHGKNTLSIFTIFVFNLLIE